MDNNKLLYFIKDRGYTVVDFCSKIGMSYSSFYTKCKKQKFFLNDVWKIGKFLDLSLEEINSIFFANYVS